MAPLPIDVFDSIVEVRQGCSHVFSARVAHRIEVGCWFGGTRACVVCACLSVSISVSLRLHLTCKQLIFAAVISNSLFWCFSSSFLLLLLLFPLSFLPLGFVLLSQKTSKPPINVPHQVDTMILTFSKMHDGFITCSDYSLLIPLTALKVFFSPRYKQGVVFYTSGRGNLEIRDEKIWEEKRERERKKMKERERRPTVTCAIVPPKVSRSHETHQIFQFLFIQFSGAFS